jgi:predicted acetyltransferase
MGMSLEVERVNVQQRGLLRNLLNMYLHEMSHYDDIEIGTDGNMEYPHFSCYWVEPERHPFLIKIKGQIAGFVMVRDIESYRGGSIHTVAEFFVLNVYRRLGIGEEIARIVFDQFPGQWQIAVQEDNKVGRTFWKTVIWRYTGGKIHEFRTNDWRGPIFEFGSTGAAHATAPPMPAEE